MPQAGIFILAIGGVVLAFHRSLRVAFTTLLAFWLLVPASLILPGGPHIVLVDRLVLWAFAFRVFVRVNSPGNATTRALRLTGVHFAMAGVLFAGYLDGVVLAAHGVSLASDIDTWLYTLDMALFFVVALAVIRTTGAWPVVRTVSILVAGAVFIGIVERLSGSGWSHFMFEHLSSSYQATGAAPLGTRGGHVRSQAAAQFSLEYAWVLVMLLPVVTVGAFAWVRRSTRKAARLAYLLPIGAVVGVALTASRSAEVGIGAVAVLLVIAAGAPRQLTKAALTAVGAVLLLSLAVPTLLGSPFNAAAHSDSVSVRLQRLPDIFALVVHRPYTGLGYSGLFGSVAGLDNSYALLYATIGVLGLAAWAFMLITTAATAARALRAPRDTDTRTLGAACLVGIVAVLVAAAAYDLVATPQSQWTFMFLAALGVAVAEPVPRRVPPRRWWTARALLPVLGVAGGILMLGLAPSTSSESVSVFMASPAVIAASHAPVDDYTGKVLGNTLCGFLDHPSQVIDGTTLRCQRLSDVVPNVWPTLMLVRITGPTPDAVRAEYQHAFGQYAPYIQGQIAPVGPVASGKPAWATTAPVWVGLVGLVAMFLIPPLSRRPLSARAPPREPVVFGRPGTRRRSTSRAPSGSAAGPTGRAPVPAT
ncbi:MAG TPA: O-antigen ligase family protein [Acidimicrobiales bacterium]|nr:O-antigen ligase family protein [Acidimicrobiales bacterium]